MSVSCLPGFLLLLLQLTQAQLSLLVLLFVGFLLCLPRVQRLWTTCWVCQLFLGLPNLLDALAFLLRYPLQLFSLRLLFLEVLDTVGKLLRVLVQKSGCKGCNYAKQKLSVAWPLLESESLPPGRASSASGSLTTPAQQRS